ncbi:hypothetical protein M407DRAFT_219551 [Tulasnella calospora MUT 4182]|uniref:U3 small nucleolar RNA-associated protein 6 N-terminal domain-containing protein n=1 Tax=Tulasnella calospora MUT 4182 TaxID=1051891 RepID=A0A0C3KHM1_9AGAM|nr:hypothetical protein M407DRAFT_219551 [Tulasnella calospora MUT 4182]
MEFVMTRQEAMAGELKELMLKGLLTETEVKHIVARRTAFESALIRLEPKKSDYLRYIEYLMALEALRRKRMKRLDLTGQGPSKADYCLVEAQFNVFERAVRKFKDDISLWVQFIEHARREKAVVLTGKLTARALQLHPSSVPLYILAARHQMEAQTPGGARTMFQRGLRLNPESAELWTEYLKMELSYIETLRRELKRTRDLRKQLIKKAKKKGEEIPDELKEAVQEDENLKEIMDGAIVREVLRNAVEAHPKVALFATLRRLLFNHPTPMRDSLLSELHAWLVKLLPRDPHAIKLSAVWWIDDNWTEGSDIVEKLHSANSKMMAAVKSDDVDSRTMGTLYAQWISQSVRRVNSTPLKEYFTRSLHTLIANLPRTRLCPNLLATDLQLAALRQPETNAKAKSVTRARKYVDLFPTSAEIWIPYLSLAKDAGTAEWRTLWDEAREKARGTVDELCRICSFLGTATDLTGQGPSKADYCLVEAQFNVFERAVRKFKDDISLWVQFIEHARREKAVVLTGKLTARALQLHPSSVPLYILAARHQMEAQTPGGARTMFQRGLRLNPESAELWTEYLKMELSYIETLRRELKRTRDLRKQLIKKAKKKGEEIPDELKEAVQEDENLKEIMDGAIVREVLRNAVEAHPKVALFATLRRLLFNHPTPMRDSLLSELHAWLVKLLPRDPHAIKLSAVWWIDDNWTEGSDIVEKLHSANSKMMAAVKSDDVDSRTMGTLYAQWISQSVRRVNSTPLKEYFTRSLHTLIANLPRTRLCPNLLATDLQLAALRQPETNAKAKSVTRARKYVDLFPTSAEIWIPYLSLAKDAGTAEWRTLWDEAREKARGTVDELCRIWLWGIPLFDNTKAKDEIYEVGGSPDSGQRRP